MAKGQLDQIRAKKLAQEFAKRTSVDLQSELDAKAEALLDSLTPQQRAFVKDPSRQKAALCTRRSGKTHGSKIALLYTALTKPHSVCVYINRTRAECRNIAWKGQHSLPALNDKFDLGATLNKTYLELEFPNGSVIRLIGCEDSADLEKLRGDAYDLVVIDESQKIGELKYFCEDIIFPALGDRRGSVILIGTPSRVPVGYFYEITREGSKIPGWSIHQWTYRDNTHLPWLVEEFAAKKKANGWGDDHPTWLREYCAIWVKSSEGLVYAFNQIPEEERYHDGLPETVNVRGIEVPIDWEYIVGVDFGFKDPFAYSIWAYSTNHPIAYEVESFKQSRLTSDEQGDIIVDLTRRYQFTKIVTDDNQPAMVEDWRKRKGLQIQTAYKKHKRDYQEQWNSAMVAGKVKFYKGSPLAAELQTLQWVEKTIHTSRPKEDKVNSSNDVCDAALYSWKEVLSWAWEQPDVRPQFGTADFYKQQEEEWLNSLTDYDDEPSNYYELLGQ